MTGPTLPPGFTLETRPLVLGSERPFAFASEPVAVVLMRGDVPFAQRVARSPRRIRREARKLTALAHSCHALDSGQPS